MSRDQGIHHPHRRFRREPDRHRPQVRLHVEEIAALNSGLFENPRLIFAGWVLTLPAK